MSRFFMTDAPALAPGVCWITKSGVGPFVDTGIDLSKNVVDRGRMYISVDALREMAQIAGLFDEKEPISVDLKKKEWYQRGYQDALEEMNKDVISHFVERVVSHSVNTAGAAISVAPENSGQPAGAAVTIDEGTTEIELPVGEGASSPERKSSSTGSVKRSARVSTDSSDESNFRL